ncbi:MAG: EF-hand domain-containing protein [Bradyrhizobium sp.]|nr:EF-hand domain-containing protein [Bradyrhizobium sp.]
MLLALGAASTAIDSLFGLISPKQTQAAGSGQDQPNLFAFQADAATNSAGTSAGPTGGGGGQIAPETMSALLAAQSQSGTSFQPMSREDALKDLFSKIDTDGDGKITKSEFENALGAGGTNTAQADDVFSKLDKNGDGSVTMDEMSSALKGGRGHHGGHHHMPSGAGDGSGDPLMQALDSATGGTVTNADGSTTTSLTYADGSTVTMTKPAASTASTTATSSYNFLEQLIQRQANAIAAQTSSTLSVSV